MRSWRAAWYQANPEGLVGRLRDLARSRPEAARALATRLEREGWGPWWELLGDLQAPRALCPVCEGEGEVLTTGAVASGWHTCPTCGGQGLMPYPLTQWREYCHECWGEGGWWAYHPHRPDDDIWVECPECGGIGVFTRMGPAAYAEVRGRVEEDFPPDAPLPF
ncbi:hypothetical protein A0O31_01621 [Thermus brockianus]|uniref:Uncharacterized protein n=1 Tax=Thermus brockianus TaxID=56956 RepID=A0A1J0LTK5_THEBO|nr:hypothetical protein A0O31_01621 [Thermus brockianus]